MNPTNPAYPAPLIEALFPAGVRAAELAGSGSTVLLLPEEAAGLGRMVPSRAAEFAAGRLCARAVLARFGIHDFPLLAGTDRKPVWPDRVIGSITHTEGICMAVAALRGELMGLGVDTEVVGRVSDEIAARICVPAELDWLDALPGAQRAAAATLLFAAKEAFYKAQSPQTNQWLEFEAVSVSVGDLSAPLAAGVVGELQVSPMHPIALQGLVPAPYRGHFRFHGEFVSVGVALSTPGRRGTP